jgi:hypothetical protein
VKLMECFLFVGFVIAAFGRDSFPFGGSDAHRFHPVSLLAVPVSVPIHLGV